MKYVIHTKPGCKYCDRAKDELDFLGESYLEVKYETEDDIQRFKDSGFKTFPQIYVMNNGISEHIGGFTELRNVLTEFA